MGKIITKTKGSVTIPADGELYSRNFNDTEIRRRTKADSDIQPLTDEQLKKFKRVSPFNKHN